MKAMSDFSDKLVEAIAARIITGDSLDEIKLPEPFGILRWTGWKQGWNTFSYHAQIVWMMPGKDDIFYVDIPSMQHGRVKKRNPFSVEFVGDSHHVDEYTTVEDIRRWFVEAFTLLLTDVLADNEWLIQVPPSR